MKATPKQLAGLLVLIIGAVGFCVGYWFHVGRENMPTLSYVCEDNAFFIVNFVKEDELQISTQEKLHVFKLEPGDDDRIRIFGNTEYAVTFVSTHNDDRIIFTHRNKEEPHSTICQKN